MIDRVDGMIAAAPSPINQPAGVVDEEPGAGRAGEDHETSQQQRPPPQPVAQRTGEQEQTGEDDGVRVDDPLELGLSGAEIACDIGQRDVER
jgi:hypothetical protein